MAKKPPRQDSAKKAKPAGKRGGKSGGPPPAELALIGELAEETETELVNDLLDLEPGAAATIYFDCSGGSVYSALAVATLLQARRIDATAVVLSECSSAALLVFAACRRRLVTPRSVFLFHRIKWRGEKDMRREEAANWAQHFVWLEGEADRYQAELFGAAEDRIREWIEEGQFVLGPELVELGLAEFMPKA
jgi:ATP-dependent protease ClpP protease subunit